MESWRHVWREAIAPLLSANALNALRSALVEDRQELIQDYTVDPLAAFLGDARPVEGACAISYCGWRGEQLATVGEVDEFFARMCHEIDRRMGYDKAYLQFVTWFDSEQRTTMRRLLLPEIDLALATKTSPLASHPSSLAGAAAPAVSTGPAA